MAVEPLLAGVATHHGGASVDFPAPTIHQRGGCGTGRLTGLGFVGRRMRRIVGGGSIGTRGTGTGIDIVDGGVSMSSDIMDSVVGTLDQVKT